jgi:hypothetical protein
MVLLNGSFNDGHEFALKRPMVPLCPFAEALNNLIRCVFDREIDGHGSESAPEQMLQLAVLGSPVIRTA